MLSMRASLWIATSIGAVAVAACGMGGGDVSTTATSNTVSRLYSGTASVGDFMTIRLHPSSSSAGTIDFNNISTGESGTVPYTVAGDGSYNITDPQGHLVTAYEIPGYALVATSNRTGPNNEPSIVTAITSTSITKASIASRDYNYIQFRTNNGGMELGWVHTQVDGSIQHQGYWPYGEQNGGTAFQTPSTFSSAGMDSVPGINALRILTDPPNGYSYIFRTTAGFLAVDTGNGGLVCVKQAASKDFDPTNAGTYKAVVYRKQNATMDFTGGGNGVETGTPGLGKGTVTISASGHVTVVGENGMTLADSNLTPLADNGALVGTGKLQDPCHGLFTFQLSSGGLVQTVFVAFLDQALLMSSYSLNPAATNTMNHSKPYNYFYGVALKNPPTAPSAPN